MAVAHLEIVKFTDQANWHWRLTDESGNFLADHTVGLDRASNEFDGFVDLHRFIRWNSDVDAPDRDPILLEQVARWIRREVWGPIGDRAIGLAEQAPLTLYLSIPKPAEALLFLPLELGLRLDPAPAALDISLICDADEDKVVHKNEIGDRLRMLAIFSMPTDQAALNVRRERHELKKLVHRVAHTAGRAVELRILQYGVTRELIEEVLEEGQGWDLIHFSGHGLPAGLVLENEHGNADVVRSGEIADLLWPSREQLKLVTLSSCESGAAKAAHDLQLLGIEGADTREAVERPDVEAAHPPLPALAQSLTDRLGCAALAMRYPVEDDFAIGLSADLYQGLLAQDQSLPRALQSALRKAWKREGDKPGAGLSLATPALFGKAALNLHLGPPPGEPLSFDASEASMPGFPPEPETFVGRVGPLARGSAAVAPKSPFRGILFYGMAGAGKTACALELAYRHRSQRFEAMAWYSAPLEGEEVDEALGRFAAALQAQIDGLEIAHIIDDVERLENFLPRFRRLLADRSLLLVLDNVESLLTAEGEWRDPRWALFVNSLIDHDGLSRLILTSRIPPQRLLADSRIRAEPIHSLSANESMLLARQMPNLGSLMREGASGDLAVGRRLVREALQVAQGNPKLLELADAQATSPENLQARIDDADEAWTDRGDLDTFFSTGSPDTEIDAEDFLRVIQRWAASITANLSAASRLAFQFLCCMEETDRRAVVFKLIWPNLWTRNGGEGEPNDFAEVLSEVARQGLIDVKQHSHSPSYGIHPAVENAALRSISQELRVSVEEEMAGLWIAMYEHAYQSNDTRMVVRSGLGAAPYLLRRNEPGHAAVYLDKAITRDPSVPTLAAAIPILARAARQATGTDAEFVTRGILARAKAAQRSSDVLPELQSLLKIAKESGDASGASSVLTDLLSVLLQKGHLAQAEEVLDEMQALGAEAGRSAWSLLGNRVMSLRLKQMRGENEAVLEEIHAIEDEIGRLEGDEDIDPEGIAAWNVRETLWGVGFSAAMSLKQWEQALEFNERIRSSEEGREAPQLTRAVSGFNAFGPLVELNRLPDAEVVLVNLRQTLEQSGDLRRLGEVFDSWAILEMKRGHLDNALAFGYRALRHCYRMGEPRAIAVSHHNLATHLTQADSDPKDIVAHRLAAALVTHQTQAGEHKRQVAIAALSIRILGKDSLPASFDELHERLDAIEGCHFTALLSRLPATEATGEDALQAVLAEIEETIRNEGPLSSDS